MAVLDNKLQEKIDDLINIGNEFWDQDKSQYYKKLFEAWELYPEPKKNWNEAYSLAKEIYQAYILEENFDKAKEWLNKMIDNNNHLHLFDEDCTFNYAKYQFEIGEYKDSYAKFKEVVEVAGVRYFEDEDPKYLKFYKNPEKHIK